MNKTALNIKLSSNLSFDMILVEGGTFSMGDQESRFESERPVHQVMLKSFYMSKYQVTQDLWESLMGNNPSRFEEKKRPVENVSWDEVKKFITVINKETGQSFRLPSESEWEFAAKGGKYSEGYQYSGSDKLSQVGWYEKNSQNSTQEVGQLLANELGLYDMSGNVYEWCEDDWHENYEGAPGDGSAWVDTPKRGDRRVARGGSYFDDPVSCRPANRGRSTPGDRNGRLGFRLVFPSSQ